MAVDAELANALKAAKSKPMFFAFVAKGTEGKLLVAKAKVPAKEVAEAKKASGGGTVFQGRCVYEGDTLVCELPKEGPGTLAGLIKKTIKNEAGLSMNVTLRVNAALAESEGGENQEEAAGAISEAAPPTAPPSAADPRAAKVTQRLNSMSASIKAAMAGPNKTRVQTLFVAANAALKNHDYDAATKSLNELEPLITTAPTTATPPAPPPVDHDGAAVVKRLNAISGDIKAALAGPKKAEVQARFVAVNAAIKNHDYAGAAKTLDELTKLLNGAAPSAGGSQGQISLVKLGKARIEWNNVRLHAVQEIQRLKQILEDEYKDDEEDKKVLAQALQRLDSTINTMNAELGDQLDRLLNADGTERAKLAPIAKTVVEKMISFVGTDELMAVMDGNEYAPDMLVTAPIRRKLQEIAATLG